MGIGFVGLIAWIKLVRVSKITFPKIKKHQPVLYSEILSTREKAWLERGWHSPTDLAVQFRLYRSIYRGKASEVISVKSWKIFVWSARLFIIASSIFFVGHIVLMACLLTKAST